MKTRMIRFITVGLVAAGLLSFVFINPAGADSSCYVDKLLEKEHSLPGDVNNDGVVNSKDTDAIRAIINGSPVPDYYNSADVNCDGTVDSGDLIHLSYFLWEIGPPPCVSQVQFCTGSPCYVRLDGRLIKLNAAVTWKETNRASFLATSNRTDMNDTSQIAYLRLDVIYGDELTELNVTFERKSNPYGLPVINSTTVKNVMFTPYTPEGARGEVDVMTALMGVAALTTAEINPSYGDLSVPKKPSQCRAPVNIPTYETSILQESCCVSHDFCYQRGGTEQDRKRCDENFFNCLDKLASPSIDYWCGAWAYRREYVQNFIRAFTSHKFRYHNEDWACHFFSKGPDIDNLLDGATLLNDCRSCAGKTTCDLKCAVQVGNAVTEYPCLQMKEIISKPAETPWKTNQNGTLGTNIAWNYTMGYHFTPQKSGTITKLGGLFNGTKTVYLWNRSTGQLLAQASVTSANAWSYADITPVRVEAGKSYTVAVYLAGSGASRRTSIAALPKIYGDIKIDYSTYNTYNRRPTNSVSTTMYGQADIVFQPD